MNKKPISRKTGYFIRKDVYNKRTGGYEDRYYKTVRDEKGRFKSLFYVSSFYRKTKETPKEQKKFIKQKYEFDKKLSGYKIKPMRTFFKKRFKQLFFYYNICIIVSSFIGFFSIIFIILSLIFFNAPVSFLSFYH